MTISILIPVYNYDIVALVRSLAGGIKDVPGFCEIIIGDDGSATKYRNKLKSLVADNVRLVVSDANIGRAAIRNKLALQAKGELLLFLDADVRLTGSANNYLHEWLRYIKSEMVICGGTIYPDNKPGDPDKYLRWRYGKTKEQKKASERNKHPYRYFSTFNVLIDKAVFSKLRFYEEIRQYGHEDTLLGFQLKKAGINVLHIDNGLVHEGVESNVDFLNKTKLGIENLSILYDKVTDKRRFSSCETIIRTYSIIRFFRLTLLLASLFIRYRERMERRLDSTTASLRLFSFYKISMFCTYREIHRRRNLRPVF